jgi:hypothetical protein
MNSAFPGRRRKVAAPKAPPPTPVEKMTEVRRPTLKLKKRGK